jgi:regulator of RNase E activity RraA
MSSYRDVIVSPLLDLEVTTPEADVIDRLTRVSVGTVAGILQNDFGIRACVPMGLVPLTEQGLCGRAITLRFLPMRSDIYDALYPDTMSFYARQPKRIVMDRQVGPRDVLVMEGGRHASQGGLLGDILAERLMRRGASGVVVDGAVRDGAALHQLPLGVFARSVHAGIANTREGESLDVEANGAITCGGCLVMPGDIVRGDADGLVVIPGRLAQKVAAKAEDKESRERFVADRVRHGDCLEGLYPASQWSAETETRYLQWLERAK